MKKFTLLTSFLVLTVCVAITFLSSCSDDEKKPKNQFKVNGKSYALSNGYIDSELNIGDGSAHYVIFTGKDLEVDEDGLISGEDHFFILQIGSTEPDELAKDTYDIDIEVYEFGNVPEFFVAANYHFVSDGDGGFNEAYDEAFYPNEGTVKVSKSGSKYTFTVKVTDFVYEDENGDQDDGEGDLRAYFSGSLDNVSLFSEEGRAPAKVRTLFKSLKSGKGFGKN